MGLSIHTNSQLVGKTKATGCRCSHSSPQDARPKPLPPKPPPRTSKAPTQVSALPHSSHAPFTHVHPLTQARKSPRVDVASEYKSLLARSLSFFSSRTCKCSLLIRPYPEEFSFFTFHFLSLLEVFEYTDFFVFFLSCVLVLDRLRHGSCLSRGTGSQMNVA